MNQLANYGIAITSYELKVKWKKILNIQDEYEIPEIIKKCLKKNKKNDLVNKFNYKNG